MMQAQEDLATIKKQGGAGARSDAALEAKLKALQKDYDDLAARQGNGPKAAAVRKGD